MLKNITLATNSVFPLLKLDLDGVLCYFDSSIIGKTKSTIFLFQKYKNNLVPKHLVYGV